MIPILEHDLKQIFLNTLSVVRLFMKRRTEQLDAIKRLLAIDSYEKQYKMVSVIAEKVFSVRLWAD